MHKLLQEHGKLEVQVFYVKVIVKSCNSLSIGNFYETTKNNEKKIPHTGDKESLDRCG